MLSPFILLVLVAASVTVIQGKPFETHNAGTEFQFVKGPDFSNHPDIPEEGRFQDGDGVDDPTELRAMEVHNINIRKRRNDKFEKKENIVVIPKKSPTQVTTTSTTAVEKLVTQEIKPEIDNTKRFSPKVLVPAFVGKKEQKNHKTTTESVTDEELTTDDPTTTLSSKKNKKKKQGSNEGVDKAIKKLLEKDKERDDNSDKKVIIIVKNYGNSEDVTEKKKKTEKKDSKGENVAKLEDATSKKTNKKKKNPKEDDIVDDEIVKSVKKTVTSKNGKKKTSYNKDTTTTVSETPMTVPSFPFEFPWMFYQTTTLTPTPPEELETSTPLSTYWSEIQDPSSFVTAPPFNPFLKLLEKSHPDAINNMKGKWWNNGFDYKQFLGTVPPIPATFTRRFQEIESMLHANQQTGNIASVLLQKFMNKSPETEPTVPTVTPTEQTTMDSTFSTAIFTDETTTILPTVPSVISTETIVTKKPFFFTESTKTSEVTENDPNVGRLVNLYKEAKSSFKKLQPEEILKEAKKQADDMFNNMQKELKNHFPFKYFG